jgi:hypothetical protein
MTTFNRRSLVAGAATLPALTVPVVSDAIAPSQSDPIFAAIEKHRTAFAAFVAHSEYEDDLAEKGRELTPAPGETHRTSEMVAVVTASRTARAELAKTAPTTMAGIRGYFDYLLTEADKSEEPLFLDEDEHINFIKSLSRAAKLIERKAVQS